ncbi:MAG: hypothetical protein IKB50_01330 [Clostridia bacterium]|nr:hypothetical protein [Clostridia bacterium]
MAKKSPISKARKVEEAANEKSAEKIEKLTRSDLLMHRAVSSVIGKLAGVTVVKSFRKIKWALGTVAGAGALYSVYRRYFKKED